jgi:hypothetical protein
MASNAGGGASKDDAYYVFAELAANEVLRLRREEQEQRRDASVTTTAVATAPSPAATVLAALARVIAKCLDYHAPLTKSKLAAALLPQRQKPPACPAAVAASSSSSAARAVVVSVEAVGSGKPVIPALRVTPDTAATVGQLKELVWSVAKGAIVAEAASSSTLLKQSLSLLLASKPSVAAARIRLFAGQGGAELSDDSRPLWPTGDGAGDDGGDDNENGAAALLLLTDGATLALALRDPPRAVKVSRSDMFQLRRVLSNSNGSGSSNINPWPSLRALGLRPEDKPYYVEYGDYDGHWDFRFEFDLEGEYKDYRPREGGSYFSVLDYARKNNLTEVVAALSKRE